jgi:hypothetical protein
MQHTLSVTGPIIAAELLNAIVGREQLYCCAPGTVDSASPHILLFRTLYCATHVTVSAPCSPTIEEFVRLTAVAKLLVML